YDRRKCKGLGRPSPKTKINTRLRHSCKKLTVANIVTVISRYEEEAGTYKSRYDITFLVNGLPLIHIELKRRGVAVREAFNQIN
ncbi:MAG TPA: hypothetical protein GX707_10510, partial [Epulopiscium sp.]|nr:hypothetical protein [Candidatus Epulonipiscium sp.]